MYREVVKPSPMKFWQAALLILSIIFFVIIFTAICNILFNVFHIELMNYIVYLAIIYIAWEVFRRRSIEYKYSLICDALVFEKIIGNYTIASLTVKLNNMEALLPLDQAKAIKARTAYKFVHISCKKKIYCAIFKDDKGAVYKVYFQPDKTMLHLLQTQAARQVCQS